MKILVANKFLGPVGGVEAHIAHVSDWLRAAGHTVVPFAMADEDTPDTEYSRYFPSKRDFRVSGLRDGVRTLERATLSSETREKLRDLLRAESIDAAYVAHVYHQLGTVMLNDLADAGIPVVLSLHDYKVACPNYRFFSERTDELCTTCLDHRSGYVWGPTVKGCWSGSRVAGLALSVEAVATKARGSYRRADVVVVLNSLQERAAKHAGVRPDRIRRIAHPVTLGPSRPATDSSHVLYVGRLVPEKGVDVLIRASHASGVPVRIVGAGRSEAALRSLAEELGAPVEFLGSVPGREVSSHLGRAAALVVPSVWHEVSPLVVYEAISADVAVIATAVGGMVDQLGEGRGVLVKPGDVTELAAAMRRVVDDAAYGRTLSAAARAHAGEFLTPSRWSAALVEAFRAAGAAEFSA